MSTFTMTFQPEADNIETQQAGPRRRGHTNEFVFAPPDSFKCLQCQLVLRNPIQTDCGHSFCKECFQVLIDKHVLSNTTLLCPIGKTPIESEEVFADMRLTRMVGDLLAYCEYKNDGCDWQGELRYAEAHGCSYRPVLCPFSKYGCTKKVLPASQVHDDPHNHIQLVDKIKKKYETKLQALQQDSDWSAFNDSKYKNLPVREIITMDNLIADDEGGGSSREINGYTWVIKGIKAKFERARRHDIKKKVLSSGAFYLGSPHGYCFLMKIYPNGISGNGNLSVHLQLITGVYDSTVTWPCNLKVQIEAKSTCMQYAGKVVKTAMVDFGNLIPRTKQNPENALNGIDEKTSVDNFIERHETDKFINKKDEMIFSCAVV